MKWFFQTKNEERNLFGLDNDRTEWSLLDSGDAQVESGALGPSDDHSQWVNLGNPVLPQRWRLAFVLITIFFGLLLARTAMLQVAQGDEFREIADANRTKVKILPAHRGIIKDRNGIELAKNSPTFRLLIWPKELPVVEEERQLLLERAVATLNLPENTFTDFEDLVKDNQEAVLSIEDIPYDRALAFWSKQDVYPGLTLEFTEYRQYYTTAVPSLSHVLGYTGPINEDEYVRLEPLGYRRFDTVGKQGLEAAYEPALRGTFGREIVEVDAQGRILRSVSRQEPVDGQDLTLTLDAKLQSYIEVALENRLKSAPTQRAAVVALRPDTGEILALVSTPSFDANLFSQGISSEAYSRLLNDPDKPLFPRAYAGEYPAGSTIKPTFAAAALSSGLITTKTTFFSSGGVMLGNRFFPDWRPGGHGVTNVYHAIADSVNTFFYMIGGGNETFEGMGLDKLMTAALSFGYGQKTQLDLPGEADGFLPSKTWKEQVKGEPWYIGDTYNVSIGQGDLLVTPLQVARATAVIANGGQLVTPHLVPEAYQNSTKVLDSEIAQIVADAMRQTITAGSARMLQSLSVPVAGKTGTAQWSSTFAPHSWFTGFGPIDDPEIVITVLVEQGGKDNYAIPLARDIFDWYFSNAD